MIRRFCSTAILVVLALSGTAKVEAQTWSEPRCYSWTNYFSQRDLWLQRKSERGDVSVYGRAEITLNGPRTVTWEFWGKDLDIVYQVQVSETGEDGLIVREMEFIKNTPLELIISGRVYDLVECDRLFMDVRPISED